MPKKIITSVIISVIAYLAIAVLTGAIQVLPTGPNEFIVLIVLLLATVAASLGSAASNQSATASTGGNAGAGTETGTVKWFNMKKGYGFITRDQGDDVFVHFRNINGEGRRGIKDGERVQFVVVDGDKGLQAENVDPV